VRVEVKTRREVYRCAAIRQVEAARIAKALTSTSVSLVFASARDSVSHQPDSYGAGLCGGTTQLNTTGRRQRLDEFQMIA
jgi:hypothetical protein